MCDGLSDLYRVGPGKPLGYLPLSTILERGANPWVVYGELQAFGLHVCIMSSEWCHVGSGALWAWHQEAMRSLLLKNQGILNEVKWPICAAEFVLRVIRNTARIDSPLYELIGVAFADSRFKFRHYYTSQPQPPDICWEP